MTAANAISVRATDGPMRNGRFAPETMTRPQAADEDNQHEERLATGLGLPRRWNGPPVRPSNTSSPGGVAPGSDNAE